MAPFGDLNENFLQTAMLRESFAGSWGGTCETWPLWWKEGGGKAVGDGYSVGEGRL